jgi:hypothetical protein
MNPKTYCALSATIFAVVALAHLMRIVNGWNVEVGMLQIPMFISWFGFIVPALLAYFGFRAAIGNLD